MEKKQSTLVEVYDMEQILTERDNTRPLADLVFFCLCNKKQLNRSVKIIRPP